MRPHTYPNRDEVTKIRSYASFASGNSHTMRHSAPPQNADGALKLTQREHGRRRASALAPPTLANPVSSSHRATEQCVPGAMRANCAGAHSSIFCTENRPSEPRLSSCMRQTLPIAQVIDLRRKSQTVNAWKPNSRSTQTARQGRMGARAGSPGAIGRPGRRRQTSAHRNQTGAIMRRVVEGASAANSAAPIKRNRKARQSTLPDSTHSTTLYGPEHRVCRLSLYS